MPVVARSAPERIRELVFDDQWLRRHTAVPTRAHESGEGTIHDRPAHLISTRVADRAHDQFVGVVGVDGIITVPLDPHGAPSFKSSEQTSSAVNQVAIFQSHSMWSVPR